MLLGTFDPDSWLLRTSQACLFLEQCPEWSENWPDSGMWDAGGVYELLNSEPVTCENECSSSQNWLTPFGMGGIDHSGKMGSGGEFAKQVTNWPTHRASSGGGNRSAYEGAPYRPALAQRAQEMNWPTARAEDAESARNHPGAVDSLMGASGVWSPSDAPGSGGPRNRQDSTGQGHQVTIAEQAERWQTPATDSFRSRLRWTCSVANQAKRALTDEEFLALCAEVVAKHSRSPSGSRAE